HRILAAFAMDRNSARPSDRAVYERIFDHGRSAPGGQRRFHEFAGGPGLRREHQARIGRAMSISTKRGDAGQTGLPGGIRVSKADPRVECYGTIDELISQIGFTRSISRDAEIAEWLKDIQRELFKVGSAIGTAPESRKPAPEITEAMVAVLDAHVARV